MATSISDCTKEIFSDRSTKMHRAMSTQSCKIGFPLSSTPIQSFEDSGYFGSCHKKSSSKAKALNVCSPIKEYPNRNILSKHPYIEQDSFVFETPKTKNVADCSNFSKCDLSSDTGIHELTEQDVDSLSEICKYNLPNYQNSSEQSSSPDFASGRESSYSLDSLSKIEDIKYELFPGFHSEDVHVTDNFKYPKRTKVDFLHELKQINCVSIISTVLSYLSAKELCTASCVSKEWNEAVSGDRRANFRKEQLLREQVEFLTGPSKENRLGMRCGPAREHKKAFTYLTNTRNVEDQISSPATGNTRFDSFINEAKKGYTKLLKCPVCCYASKFENEKKCVCTNCSYTFCCECFGPIYKNHNCFNTELPKTIIGSKQSKRNLKRL